MRLEYVCGLVSGSTILGNGDVALILGVGPLVTEYADLEKMRHSTSRRRGGPRRVGGR